MRLLLIVAFILIAPLPSFAKVFGDWHSDHAHGYERYWTENAKGNRFTIWCPPSHQPKDALISVNIRGAATPNSLVRVVIGRKLVKFHTGPKGFIRNNCAACLDNLRYFWHQLRSSKNFVVQFEDERHAGFSSEGIKAATPASVCANQLASQGR